MSCSNDSLSMRLCNAKKDRESSVDRMALYRLTKEVKEIPEDYLVIQWIFQFFCLSCFVLFSHLLDLASIRYYWKRAQELISRTDGTGKVFYILSDNLLGEVGDFLKKLNATANSGNCQFSKKNKNLPSPLIIQKILLHLSESSLTFWGSLHIPTLYIMQTKIYTGNNAICLLHDWFKQFSVQILAFYSMVKLKIDFRRNVF